jgi:PKD repeat protein
MKKNLQNFCKLVLFLTFNFQLLAFNCVAQPSWVRGDFGAGWSDYLMINRGLVNAVTISSSTTNAANPFLFTRDLNYSPKWCGSLTDYARPINQVLHNATFYYTSGSWDHDLTLPVSNGNYYTFITTKNVTSNNDISILETSFQPVNIVNVERTPSGNPAQGNSVLIDVTLSGAKAASEHVFLRWTANNWLTSTFQEITTFNTNEQGNTTITGLPSGTNVFYYVLTTTQTNPADSTIDFFTLNINNNANANYGYTVVTSTGCPFSFSLGNDTTLCGGTGLLLNPGITVSPYGDSLTITYDATKGQSQLVGAPKVYIHAGAELHTNGGWQYTIGNWGMDDGIGLMNKIGTDLWQITINPVTYFNYPADSSLNGILMVFRDAGGTLTGKDDNGNDIWVNMKTSPPVSSFYGVTPTFLKNNYDSIEWSNGSHAQTLFVAATGTYVCTINNSTGGCSYTDSIRVIVQPIPFVELGNDQTLCNNDSITLTANPSNFASYNWSTGDTTTSIHVNSPGTYSVTVTDSYGCAGFDVVNVNFIEAPVAGFSDSLVGLTVHFLDTSHGGTAYRWDFDGNGTTESTVAGNVTHTYSIPGQYNVILIVSNECGSDTISHLIYVTSGIVQNEISSVCNVFPNPSTGYITVNIDNKDISTWQIEIFDVFGNLIYTETTKKQTPNISQQINLSTFSKGVYYLKLKNNQQNETIKIILQ